MHHLTLTLSCIPHQISSLVSDLTFNYIFSHSFYQVTVTVSCISACVILGSFLISDFKYVLYSHSFYQVTVTVSCISSCVILGSFLISDFKYISDSHSF